MKVDHPRFAHRHADRIHAWDWAQIVSADANVWRLENFKAALNQIDAKPGSLTQPEHPVKSLWLMRFVFSLGALAGLIVLLLWLPWTRGPNRLPPQTKRIAALHGERSTRTQHVLAALRGAEPPIAAIVLLGRLRRRAPAVARLWSGAEFGPLPPLVVPYSRAATVAALADFPGLWRDGWRAAAQTSGKVSVTECVGIGFRVWYGAVTARWWTQQAVQPDCEVIFGITGTADTTLLERAIQSVGGRTVHAAHGQLVGPNLLGFSDLALFRSQYDANAVAGCGCYGHVAIQPARPVAPTRGECGLLLLTNLAHPMNPDFRRTGPVDELAVLAAVAGAAQRLGAVAQPLWWKPHPVIKDLPASEARAIRREAKRLGWTELAPDASTSDIASNARWVVATPSTVALDMLRDGVLCVMVDPRGTLLDTAASTMPTADCSVEGVERALQALVDPAAHAARFAQTWAAIGPARTLDLTQPLL